MSGWIPYVLPLAVFAAAPRQQKTLKKRNAQLSAQLGKKTDQINDLKKKLSQTEKEAQQWQAQYEEVKQKLSKVHREQQLKARRAGANRAKLLEQLKGLAARAGVTARMTEDGPTLVVPASRLFANAEADELSGTGKEVLQKVAAFLAAKQYAVCVAGHTDSETSGVGSSASRLCLTAAQAAAVIQELVSCGAPEDKMSLAAWGSNRPMSNKTTPYAKSLNRRIEIVLLASD